MLTLNTVVEKVFVAKIWLLFKKFFLFWGGGGEFPIPTCLAPPLSLPTQALLLRSAMLLLLPAIHRGISNLKHKDGIDKITDVIKIQRNLWTVNFKNTHKRSARLEQLLTNVIAKKGLVFPKGCLDKLKPKN